MIAESAGRQIPVQREETGFMPNSATVKVVKGWMFRALSWIERTCSTEYELRYSPTFIIGPLRSGTTLVRQLVAWAIPTSYFTNLTRSSWHHLGYPLPITTARLAKWLRLTRYSPSYESNYGYTTGLGRPCEASELWNYWFRTKNTAVDPEGLSAEQERLVYRAVAATERIFDRPFVNKTVDLSIRIRAVVKIFPSALFVQVFRDPLDVAQSIYKARVIDFPEREYFSTKPRECEDISGKSIVEQVCEQVYYVEKNIAFERSIVGEDRFLPVRYKDVCDRPLHELRRIAEFMDGHGVPAPIVRSIPGSFRYSHGRKLDEANYLAMKAYLTRLYSQGGELGNTFVTSLGLV
jgi:hypothetical protein